MDLWYTPYESTHVDCLLTRWSQLGLPVNEELRNALLSITYQNELHSVVDVLHSLTCKSEEKIAYMPAIEHQQQQQCQMMPISSPAIVTEDFEYATADYLPQEEEVDEEITTPTPLPYDLFDWPFSYHPQHQQNEDHSKNASPAFVEEEQEELKHMKEQEEMTHKYEPQYVTIEETTSEAVLDEEDSDATTAADTVSTGSKYNYKSHTSLSSTMMNSSMYHVQKQQYNSSLHPIQRAQSCLFGDEQTLVLLEIHCNSFQREDIAAIVDSIEFYCAAADDDLLLPYS